MGIAMWIDMDAVQRFLDFYNVQGNKNPAFNNNKGPGKIGLGGSIIGFLLGVHLTLLVSGLLQGTISFAMGVWCTYFTCLAFFHFMEFTSTAFYVPYSLGYSSWIINHSKAYTLASIVGWAEFWLELLVFPSLKSSALWPVPALGLATVAAGQFFRTGAMVTCGANFNHVIQTEKAPDHVLVREGLYAIFRHPSYLGFFWWSVGTQILLMNPAATVVYALASWKFFSERIPYEEETLCRFFPDYPEYMATTRIGIPFCKSYQPPAGAAKQKQG